MTLSQYYYQQWISTYEYILSWKFLTFWQTHMLCLSKGTYILLNLLQELGLAHNHNRKSIALDKAHLIKNPVDCLSCMIKSFVWHILTQHIDDDGLEIICIGPKNHTGHIHSWIYTSHREPAMA